MRNFFDRPNSRTIGNSILLVLLFLTIFVLPAFPVQWHSFLFGIFYTLIFFSAILTLEKYLKIITWVAVSTAVTQWIFEFQDLIYLETISQLLSFIFFMIVVINLISQVAKTKNVTGRVILEAINVYLLLGMVFAVIIGLITAFNPDAFSFAKAREFIDKDLSMYAELSYYSFVTLTTLGYGDIVPKTPIAKSAAILISITGQIYVAVVIAMLVGKFSSTSDSEEK